MIPKTAYSIRYVMLYLICKMNKKNKIEYIYIYIIFYLK